MPGKSLILIAVGIAILALWRPAGNLHAAGKSDDDIRRELVETFNAKGEPGLREYAQQNQETIRTALIMGIAEEGLKARNEGLIRIAMVVAGVKGDDKTLADVFVRAGIYFSLVGQNEQAMQMYKKALPFYAKANDPVGQGNVYMGEGNVYGTTGDNMKALEMYEKALPFFVKVNDPQGQGNVYQNQGDVYFRTGDNRKALEMYDTNTKLRSSLYQLATEIR